MIDAASIDKFLSAAAAAAREFVNDAAEMDGIDAENFRNNTSMTAVVCLLDDYTSAAESIFLESEAPGEGRVADSFYEFLRKVLTAAEVLTGANGGWWRPTVLDGRFEEVECSRCGAKKPYLDVKVVDGRWVCRECLAVRARTDSTTKEGPECTR